MDETLFESVRARAGFRCEYCRLPEVAHPGTFEREHIIALKHGGTSALSNLAFSCPHCNQHKGPNLAGIDRQKSPTRLIRLFHPRLHTWTYHFRWHGAELVGRTSIGRVTIAVLGINESVHLALREALLEEGVLF